MKIKVTHAIKLNTPTKEKKTTHSFRHFQCKQKQQESFINGINNKEEKKRIKKHRTNASKCVALSFRFR